DQRLARADDAAEDGLLDLEHDLRARPRAALFLLDPCGVGLELLAVLGLELLDLAERFLVAVLVAADLPGLCLEAPGGERREDDHDHPGRADLDEHAGAPRNAP